MNETRKRSRIPLADYRIGHEKLSEIWRTLSIQRLSLKEKTVSKPLKLALNKIIETISELEKAFDRDFPGRSIKDLADYRRASMK